MKTITPPVLCVVGLALFFISSADVHDPSADIWRIPRSQCHSNGDDHEHCPLSHDDGHEHYPHSHGDDHEHCPHSHDSGHEHCPHSHDDGHEHCPHSRGDDHEHCPHSHDDASLPTDVLSDRWYAHYTDTHGVRHEHPVVFRARGVVYLTTFNMQAALGANTERAIVFLYQQGCGVCEDVHLQFVDLAEVVSKRLSDGDGHRHELRAASTKRWVLAQMDLSVSPDEDEEDARGRIRQAWVPPGGQGDFPVLVVLSRVSSAVEGLTSVSWYSGPLTLAALTEILTGSDRILLDEVEQAAAMSENATHFLDGLLVC